MDTVKNIGIYFAHGYKAKKQRLNKNTRKKI